MADALRKFKGKIELVDVSDRLPGLKRVNGVADWKLQGADEDKKWHWFSRYEEVPEAMHKRLKESMFAKDDCKEMGLDRWYVLLAPRSRVVVLGKNLRGRRPDPFLFSCPWL